MTTRRKNYFTIKWHLKAKEKRLVLGNVIVALALAQAFRKEMARASMGPFCSIKRDDLMFIESDDEDEDEDEDEDIFYFKLECHGRGSQTLSIGTEKLLIELLFLATTAFGSQTRFLVWCCAPDVGLCEVSLNCCDPSLTLAETFSVPAYRPTSELRAITLQIFIGFRSCNRAMDTTRTRLACSSVAYHRSQGIMQKNAILKQTQCVIADFVELRAFYLSLRSRNDVPLNVNAMTKKQARQLGTSDDDIFTYPVGERFVVMNASMVRALIKVTLQEDALEKRVQPLCRHGKAPKLHIRCPFTGQLISSAFCRAMYHFR